MALLPKPTVDYRTVANTPMLYRMWGIVRRPIVFECEDSIVLPFDMARPGCSALDAAYMRSFEAEVALRNGKHVGCALLFSLSFSTWSMCQNFVFCHLSVFSHYRSAARLTDAHGTTQVANLWCCL